MSSNDMVPIMRALLVAVLVAQVFYLLSAFDRVDRRLARIEAAFTRIEERMP